MARFLVVTADNIDAARAACCAPDQRAQLRIGCETWPIGYYGPRGQMTIWPNQGRGAVAWGADSQWGDWNASTRTLRLHASGETINEDGQKVRSPHSTARAVIGQFEAELPLLRANNTPRQIIEKVERLLVQWREVLRQLEEEGHVPPRQQ